MLQRTSAMMAVVGMAVAMAASAVSADPLPYTEGHAGIGLAYEAGAWDLHFHAGGATIGGVVYPDQEFEPGEVVTVVPNTSTIARPAGTEWEPIGADAGETVWIIPDTSQPGVPFLGFGSHEITLGEFVNDAIDVALTGLVAPSGDAQVSLYTVEFGVPTFLWSSAAGGLGPEDSFSMPAESHRHFVFGFTEPGSYELTLTASGTHVNDGFVSDSATYLFSVAPEPASVMILALGALGLVRRRR